MLPSPKQAHAQNEASDGPNSVGKYKDKNFQGLTYPRERRAKSQYYGKTLARCPVHGFGRRCGLVCAERECVECCRLSLGLEVLAYVICQ